MQPSDINFHALFGCLPVLIVFSHVVLYLVFQYKAMRSSYLGTVDYHVV